MSFGRGSRGGAGVAKVADRDGRGLRGSVDCRIRWRGSFTLSGFGGENGVLAVVPGPAGEHWTGTRCTCQDASLC